MSDDELETEIKDSSCSLSCCCVWFCSQCCCCTLCLVVVFFTLLATGGSACPNPNKVVIDTQNNFNAQQAQPSGAGPFPGVLLIPHAFGMDQDSINKCDLLVDEGQVCIAPDIWDACQELNILNVPSLIWKLLVSDPEILINKLNKSYDYLLVQSDVDSNKLSIGPGFCLGGRLALDFGSFKPGATVIAFQPGQFAAQKERLTSSNAEWNSDSAVLVQCGANDTSPSPEECAKVQTLLEDRGVTVEQNSQEGVGHSFVDSECVDEIDKPCGQGWQTAKDFLSARFTAAPRMLNEIPISDEWITLTDEEKSNMQYGHLKCLYACSTTEGHYHQFKYH